MKARVGNVLSGLLAAAAMCASMHCGAFELTHRWSFNGDYADSIGGSDGVVVGRADQLSFEASAFGGQMVKMASDNTDNDSSNGASLNLGTGVLGTDDATIEMWAKRNAVRNGLEAKAGFLCGDAATEIPRLLKRGERFDAAILDPPRKGADAALLEAIADACIPALAYVSCNPATLARDVKRLAARGYRLEWAQPVDMFPFTGSTEVAARLFL